MDSIKIAKPKVENKVEIPKVENNKFFYDRNPEQFDISINYIEAKELLNNYTEKYKNMFGEIKIMYKEIGEGKWGQLDFTNANYLNIIENEFNIFEINLESINNGEDIRKEIINYLDSKSEDIFLSHLADKLINGDETDLDIVHTYLTNLIKFDEFDRPDMLLKWTHDTMIEDSGIDVYLTECKIGNRDYHVIIKYIEFLEETENKEKIIQELKSIKEEIKEEIKNIENADKDVQFQIPCNIELNKTEEGDLLLDELKLFLKNESIISISFDINKGGEDNYVTIKYNEESDLFYLTMDGFEDDLTLREIEEKIDSFGVIDGKILATMETIENKKDNLTIEQIKEVIDNEELKSISFNYKGKDIYIWAGNNSQGMYMSVGGGDEYGADITDVIAKLDEL